jgi:hypothetical protein
VTSTLANATAFSLFIDVNNAEQSAREGGAICLS